MMLANGAPSPETTMLSAQYGLPDKEREVEEFRDNGKPPSNRDSYPVVTSRDRSITNGP
ncbi:hemolysin secretion protein D [Anopheles sinensis]|uniref:Hemolysin secretion protein D n=1 Tax=Anopheles sinensis TaxID=74873 RepID=A0A084W558_ANOSI|nr:hemolysin secretion protein D [Anopheles sinensis]